MADATQSEQLVQLREERQKFEKTLEPYTTYIAIAKIGLVWEDPKFTAGLFVFVNMFFLFYAMTNMTTLSLFSFVMFCYYFMLLAQQFKKDLNPGGMIESLIVKVQPTFPNEKAKNYSEVCEMLVKVEFMAKDAKEFYATRVSSQSATRALIEACIFWATLTYFGNWFSGFFLVFVLTNALLATPGIVVKGYHKEAVSLAKKHGEVYFTKAMAMGKDLIAKGLEMINKGKGGDTAEQAKKTS